MEYENIIRFYDAEMTYGVFETNENVDKVKKLLEEYKKENLDYDIENFSDFLKERGIKGRWQKEPNVGVYF